MSRMASVCVMLCVMGAFAAGCGGDDDGETVNRFPALAEASPFAPAKEHLAMGVRHGEVLATAKGVPSSLQRVAGAVPHAVLRLQAYDELAQSFGEYTAFNTDPSGQRQASTFRTNPALGALDTRAQDLSTELDNSLGMASAVGLGRRSVVVDFWRTRGDWFVRWDGNLDDQNTTGKGTYGFGRERMRDDLLEDIENIAKLQQPETIIIGAGMERLLATPDGAGLSTTEWSNFALFFREAATRVRAASPKTKIALGIHWDRFARHVAPTLKEADEAEVSQEVLLDRAVTRWLLPLWEDSDLIALASYTTQDDADAATRYQFLRRLKALYGLEKQVAYYSVGVPVSNASSALIQKNSYDAFLRWNGGVDIAWIGWERMVNIDGADTANQVPTGRCEAMISDMRPFQLDVARCFDGLLDSLFQSKSITQTFLLE